jgi:hypothetical protein
MKKINLIPDRNCEKCGNPKLMYWCKRCESNCEEPECPNCKGTVLVDNEYHENCGHQKIVVPVTEQDLFDLQAGEEFDWTFETEAGESIDVLIRLETEDDKNR